MSKKMLPFEEALGTVLKSAHSLGSEHVDITASMSILPFQ